MGNNYKAEEGEEDPPPTNHSPLGPRHRVFIFVTGHVVASRKTRGVVHAVRSIERVRQLYLTGIEVQVLKNIFDKDDVGREFDTPWKNHRFRRRTDQETLWSRNLEHLIDALESTKPPVTKNQSSVLVIR